MHTNCFGERALKCVVEKCSANCKKVSRKQFCSYMHGVSKELLQNIPKHNSISQDFWTKKLALLLCNFVRTPSAYHNVFLI